MHRGAALPADRYSSPPSGRAHPGPARPGRLRLKGGAAHREGGRFAPRGEDAVDHRVVRRAVGIDEPVLRQVWRGQAARRLRADDGGGLVLRPRTGRTGTARTPRRPPPRARRGGSRPAAGAARRPPPCGRSARRHAAGRARGCRRRPSRARRTRPDSGRFPPGSGTRRFAARASMALSAPQARSRRYSRAAAASSPAAKSSVPSKTEASATRRKSASAPGTKERTGPSAAGGAVGAAGGADGAGVGSLHGYGQAAFGPAREPRHDHQRQQQPERGEREQQRAKAQPRRGVRGGKAAAVWLLTEFAAYHGKSIHHSPRFGNARPCAFPPSPISAHPHRPPCAPAHPCRHHILRAPEKRAAVRAQIDPALVRRIAPPILPHRPARAATPPTGPAAPDTPRPPHSLPSARRAAPAARAVSAVRGARGAISRKTAQNIS